MNFIRLLPVFLSILLLGAHYFRSGFFISAVIIMASPLILLIRSHWAARIIQIELVLGGFEWISTLSGLIMIRQSIGMPWIRLSIILGGVALLSICSAFVFRFKSLRERYHLYTALKSK